MATLVTARSSSIFRYLNPFVLVGNLWRHRDLIYRFAWREVEGRYRGSFLGLFWSFVNPLLLLLIYTFVFGIVFQARWPASRTTNLQEYALVLFCGITIFNIFGECVGRAPTLIVSVPNYVKKVVFPLEVLPIATLAAALFHALVSLVVLLVANILIAGTLHWTLILLPIVALPLIFLCLSIAWFLASLGVFVRDISYVIGLFVQMLFFTSAIFYAPDIIPEPFRSLQAFNPMVSIVENCRRVILWGTLPNWDELALWVVITTLMMLLGYTWFMKTKKAFADVI
jgi:lipopolysaccharide transport system permease protein